MSNGNLVIQDSVFQNNNAGTGGGAVWMRGGNINAEGTTFDGNPNPNPNP